MSISVKDDKVHIDFDKMRHTAMQGVRRASAFAGFSLNAALRDDLKDFHPSGAGMNRDKPGFHGCPRGTEDLLR